MATYKLSVDWLDEPFKLIAIHTSLEDFRLAYFLNQTLKINLSKNKKKVLTNEENSVSFSYFSWYDELSDVNWHCINNKVKIEHTVENQGSLFNLLSSTSYLLKDKKKVDFFLKIDCQEEFSTKELLETLRKIPHLVAYEIDVYTLNTKNKLILQEC